MRPEQPFIPKDDEDIHSMTLRATAEWHFRFEFWPSVRDLIWFLEEAHGRVSVSTMHARIKVLEKTGKLEAIRNPRMAQNVAIGYRTK